MYGHNRPGQKVVVENLLKATYERGWNLGYKDATEKMRVDKIDLLKKLVAEMEEEQIYLDAKGDYSDASYGVQICIRKLEIELINLEDEVE